MKEKADSISTQSIVPSIMMGIAILFSAVIGLWLFCGLGWELRAEGFGHHVWDWTQYAGVWSAILWGLAHCVAFGFNCGYAYDVLYVAKISSTNE